MEFLRVQTRRPRGQGVGGGASVGRDSQTKGRGWRAGPLRVEARRRRLCGSMPAHHGVRGWRTASSVGPDPQTRGQWWSEGSLRVQTRRLRGQGVGGGAPAGPDPQTKGSRGRGWSPCGSRPADKGVRGGGRGLCGSRPADKGPRRMEEGASAGPSPQEVRRSEVEFLRVQTRRQGVSGVVGRASAGPDPQTKGSRGRGWSPCGSRPADKGVRGGGRGLCGSRPADKGPRRMEEGASAGPSPQEVRRSEVEFLRVQTRRQGVSGVVGRASAGPYPQTKGSGVGGGAPASPDPQTKGSGVKGGAFAGPDPQTRRSGWGTGLCGSRSGGLLRTRTKV